MNCFICNRMFRNGLCVTRDCIIHEITNNYIKLNYAITKQITNDSKGICLTNLSENERGLGDMVDLYYYNVIRFNSKQECIDYIKKLSDNLVLL